MPELKPESRIYIAGTSTLPGKALWRFLSESGFTRVLKDATPQEVKSFRPEFAFFMGARSAGIGANMKFPADLFIQNARAALEFFESLIEIRPKKILYLASSCVYPVNAPQPMKTEFLGTGPLEPTSRAYAQAKIFGMELAATLSAHHSMDIVTAIPADTYGPEDDFDPENSHVTGALMRKIHEAKNSRACVTVWGSGKPVRDFLFSRDLADACVFLMKTEKNPSPVNISSGNAVNILDWARRIANVLGYSGDFICDPSKPDGAPVKTLDAAPLRALGWQRETELNTALKETYRAFLAKEAAIHA